MVSGIYSYVLNFVSLRKTYTQALVNFAGFGQGGGKG